MTEIMVQIDEKNIESMAENKIAESLVNDMHADFFGAKVGIRDGVSRAVQTYVYDHKDEIIEKCVARATAELVRKGLPRLLEKMETRVDE
jgi:hypothetical protein